MNKFVDSFVLLIGICSIIMGSQAVPVGGNAQKTITSTSDNMNKLNEMAKVQVYRIKQEISALEHYTVSILADNHYSIVSLFIE